MYIIIYTEFILVPIYIFNIKNKTNLVHYLKLLGHI